MTLSMDARGSYVLVIPHLLVISHTTELPQAGLYNLLLKVEGTVRTKGESLGSLGRVLHLMGGVTICEQPGLPDVFCQLYVSGFLQGTRVTSQV
jgi:hypothetical protein